MKLERLFTTRESVEETRARIAAYLQEHGYKPIGNIPVPLFQRGSLMGSMLGFSRKAVLTNIAVGVQADAEGRTWARVVVGADTRWQVYTARGRNFWDEEMDGLVAAVGGEAADTAEAVAAGVVTAAGLPPSGPQFAEARRRQQVRSGANWFFWIAGLSVLNTVLYRLGAEISFLVGLGATEVVEGFSIALARGLQAGAANILLAFALVLEILIAGVFVLLGIFARRGQRWAFWLGMVLYALDGIIFLLFRIWLSFGFHLFALFMLYQGLRAAKQPQSSPAPAV